MAIPPGKAEWDLGELAAETPDQNGKHPARAARKPSLKAPAKTKNRRRPGKKAR
jgi:hypothetical protein